MVPTGVIDVTPKKQKPELDHSGRKPMVVQIRGSREYKEWAEELARTDGSTLAALYDRAVRRYAKELGFPKVPPRR